MVSMKIMLHLLETIRYQQRKMDSSFSDWNKIITRIPQSLILGALFFNNFINNLVSFANKSESYNYVDDNILYPANKNFSEILSDLSNDLETLVKWFYDNYMVLNPEFIF